MLFILLHGASWALKQTNKKPLLGLRHGPGMKKETTHKKRVYIYLKDEIISTRQRKKEKKKTATTKAKQGHLK